MKRIATQILLLLATSICAFAQNYEKYYQNLPVKVAKVTTFAIPANEVRLTDCGYTLYWVSRPVTSGLRNYRVLKKGAVAGLILRAVIIAVFLLLLLLATL